MSIEYLGTPTPPLGRAITSDMLEAFSRADGFRAVRRTDTEVGLVSTRNEEATTETTTICLEGTEVYFGFHAATRSERERLIAIAEEFLEQQGIKCDLEEQ
jgi:hypothetical protein